MGAQENTPSEDFIRMIHLFADDEDLRKWFVSLKPVAPELRSTMLENVAEKMKAGGEEPGLVAAVRSLADPAVYDAALKTLTEWLG